MHGVGGVRGRLVVVSCSKEVSDIVGVGTSNVFV